MKTPSKQSWKVVTEIAEYVLKPYKIEGDLHQIKISIDPLIANAMYKRDKLMRNEEQMRTVIKLARVLDDENMAKAIKGLGYEMVITDNYDLPEPVTPKQVE